MYGTRWSSDEDAALKMGIEIGFSPAELSRHYAQAWKRTKGAIYQRAQYVHRPQTLAECATAAERTMRHGKGRIVERLRSARVDVGIVSESDFSDRSMGHRFMAWSDRVIKKDLSEDEAVQLAKELDEFLIDLVRDLR